MKVTGLMAKLIRVMEEHGDVDIEVFDKMSNDFSHVDDVVITRNDRKITATIVV